MASELFSEFALRGLELSNRIVVSPMCQYAARDGSASDWHIMHLGSFAVSGPGLVIAEATGVEPEGRISNLCLGLYSDDNERALARVVAFFREYGERTKFGVQLAHAGRKGSVLASFLPRRALTAEEGGWTPISPSFYTDSVHAPPEVMNEERIYTVRNAFRQATERAARIDVDLIELHFAHGYLVNEFLSPLINKRDDRYGGSLENRMRLALEIFEDCRAVWPSHRPMGVRISAVDWVEGGWQIEDSVVLSRELRARGCDYICASSGGVSAAQKITSGPGYQVSFAETIRREAGIPVMAVGMIWEPAQAEQVLTEGKADLIAIARGFLNDPRWAWHAAAALDEFIPYSPRYMTAHPRNPKAARFAESTEHAQAIRDLWAMEAARAQDRARRKA
jgi:2,4-dienoyl-CoA reductase-like NADH-dependent reductase (Old Yellow Enzyme family)